MSVDVTLEAGRLIVSSRPGSSVQEVASHLRGFVPEAVIKVYRGQYYVPQEWAYAVAQAFPDATRASGVSALIERQGQIKTRMELAKIEVAEALQDPQRMLEGYPLRDRLDAHQVEAVAAMTVPSLVGLALFDEQGLGKTVMSLCAFDRLHDLGRIGSLFVLAPKSALDSWLNDAKMLFGDKYMVTTATGPAAQRRRRVRAAFDILVCNYETLVSDLNLMKRTIQGKATSVMLVIDESFLVKNPDAQRSQAVAEIRPLCERAIILCGTPAPNSARDLVHQLDILHGGLPLTDRVVPDDDAELKGFVADALGNTIYLRRLKQNVLPFLPGKQVEKVYVDLQPAQQVMYDDARHDLVLAVKSVDDHEFRRNLTSFLARRSALLRICSNPGALDPSYDEVPAKLLALDTLVRELVVEAGEKVVIWSFYRYSLNALAERYRDHGLVRIDGSVTDLAARRHAIRRFREDDNVKIFLGNAAAAGVGITLTAAHHAIYESFSDQAVHYMQSTDRIHRRGQEHDVSYHVVLARHTIEEGEFDRLIQKERIGRELIGDIYEEPMTRERFLVELGAGTP